MHTVNYAKPIKFFKEIAPDDLLNVIRCNCKTTTKNPRGSRTCSCKRNGIPCVAACGDCRGIECNNRSDQNDEDDDDDGEEDYENIDRNIFDILLDF